MATPYPRGSTFATTLPCLSAALPPGQRWVGLRGSLSRLGRQCRARLSSAASVLPGGSAGSPPPSASHMPQRYTFHCVFLSAAALSVAGLPCRPHAGSSCCFSL